MGEEKLNEAYDKILKINTKSPVAHLLTREIIETAYGVYDHSTPDKKNPFPLVTKRKNSLEDWGLKNAYSRLLDLDAPSKCGKPIDDLLDMDTGDFAILMESLEKHQKKKDG